MDEIFNDDTQDFLPGLDSGYVPDEATFVCFRCGMCCKLRVFLDLEDAERIASHTGLPLEEFIIKHDDARLLELGGYILKQRDGDCVFLEQKDGAREATCLVYEVRPRVCREFVSSLSRPECQEGLRELWGLRATSLGQIEGDAEVVKAFNAYLKSLVFG